MKLQRSFTLDVFEDRGKLILCIIKVKERGLKFYLRQSDIYYTQRWLSFQHWAAYETKLEELLANDALKHMKDSLNFKLVDSVRLTIKRSAVPVDLLCEIVSDIKISPKDVTIVLECSIEYLDGDNENDSLQDDQLQKCIDKADHSCLNTRKRHESNKETGSSSNDTDLFDTLFPTNENNTSHHRQDEKNISPYKGNFQKRQTRRLTSKDNAQNNEPTRDTFRNESSSIFLFSCSEDDNNDQDRCSPGMKRTSKTPEKLQKRQKTSLNNARDSFDKKMKSLGYASSSSDESTHKSKNFNKAMAVLNARDTASDKLRKSRRCMDRKNLNLDSIKCQSSTKITKAKKRKENPKNYANLPIYSSSCNSSVLSKRKSNVMLSDTQKLNSLDEWLTKKKSKSKKRTSDRSTESENANPSPIETKTSFQEESDKQIWPNKTVRDLKLKVAKVLDEIKPIFSDKIKNLDLANLKTHDILNTFTEYQPLLDNLFHEFKNKKKIKRSNGVDHFLVMDLLSNTAQLQMMNTLSEHYEKIIEGIPKYGELFSMILMPEWILNIFMKRYHMKRESAIEFIKNQNHSNAHKETKLPIDESILL